MKDHSALVAAVVGAALIAGRLLAISRFDVNTAATILQVAGVGTAAAGTALTLLPVALVVATCTLALVVFLDESLVSLPVRGDLLFILLATATLCLAPAELALICVAVVGAAVGVRALARRKGQQVDIRHTLAQSRLLRVQAIVLGVLIAMTPIVLQRPWLPVQSITFRDGSATVGYVLGESEGQVVVMSDQDRSITFLDPLDIREREICTGPPRTGGAVDAVPQVTVRRSLIGWLFWGDQVPTYPECPDA